MSFCLCWFHFELNFIFACFPSAFFSNFVFKYSTADSLIYAMICDEWQQWTSACEWVDACVSVAMPQWLSLRGSGHASRNRVWSCMLLRGWHVCILLIVWIIPSASRHPVLNCIPQPRLKLHALACFARLQFRFCLWWRWWSYVMITTPALLKAYVCHRAFVLHLCDLHPLVIVKIWWRWQLGLWDDVKYLVASCAWNFIQTVFRFIFCSCWPSPPLFVLKNHISFCWIESRIHVCICCMVEQPVWGYRQW